MRVHTTPSVESVHAIYVHYSISSVIGPTQRRSFAFVVERKNGIAQNDKQDLGFAFYKLIQRICDTERKISGHYGKGQMTCEPPKVRAMQE